MDISQDTYVKYRIAQRFTFLSAAGFLAFAAPTYFLAKESTDNTGTPISSQIADEYNRQLDNAKALADRSARHAQLRDYMLAKNDHTQAGLYERRALDDMHAARAGLEQLERSIYANHSYNESDFYALAQRYHALGLDKLYERGDITVSFTPSHTDGLRECQYEKISIEGLDALSSSQVRRCMANKDEGDILFPVALGGISLLCGIVIADGTKHRAGWRARETYNRRRRKKEQKKRPQAN